MSLRYTFRTLLRSPRFTLVAGLSLALGVGGNVMIYTVIDDALFRPLPYRDGDRLAIVWQTQPERGVARSLSTPGDILDWARLNTVFEGIAICQAGSQPVTMIAGGLPERIQTQYANAPTFPLLGVNAFLGQTFNEREAGQSGTRRS